MEKKLKSKRGGARHGAGRPTLFGEGLRAREVFLTDEQHEKLGRLAAREGITPSAVVRKAIDSFRGVS